MAGFCGGGKGGIRGFPGKMGEGDGDFFMGSKGGSGGRGGMAPGKGGAPGGGGGFRRPFGRGGKNPEKGVGGRAASLAPFGWGGPVFWGGDGRLWAGWGREKVGGGTDGVGPPGPPLRKRKGGIKKQDFFGGPKGGGAPARRNWRAGKEKIWGKRPKEKGEILFFFFFF